MFTKISAQRAAETPVCNKQGTAHASVLHDTYWYAMPWQSLKIYPALMFSSVCFETQHTARKNIPVHVIPKHACLNKCYGVHRSLSLTSVKLLDC